MKNFLVKFSFSFAISILIIAKTVNLSFASDVPNFGICPNPGGTTIAISNSGTYSIAGDSQTHTGSDAIYGITNVNLAVTQCFCPTEGIDGIQTDWWDVSGLSQDDIASNENAGWIYIANGADWGLNKDPYLAKNISFSCDSGGNTGGSGTPTPTAAPTSTPDPTPDPDLCKNIDGIQTSVPDGLHLAGDNCIAFQLGGAPTPPPAASPSVLAASTGTGGQVLGASTSILADTSSSLIMPRVIIALIVILGVFFVLVI